MEIDHEEWSEYSLRPAPATLLCVFWRGGLDRPRVGYAKDFPADLNAVGLWWKLTGIAKEELAMDEQAAINTYNKLAPWAGFPTIQ